MKKKTIRPSPVLTDSNEHRPNYYRLTARVRLPGESDRRAQTLAEVECQDLIEALGLDFNTGSAFKYLFRAGVKTADTRQDLQKAITYLTFALDALDAE